LLLGAFRPEEIAFGRDGERHPLDPIISEFQRQFGEITVDLNKTADWRFVESLLDSERNHLGPPFRQMLFQQTHGQPLFTIELLRGMQERGDVVKDNDGNWVEGPSLDWETLPARVEAVIGERIKRLAHPHQATLRIASVEGEEFSAEVVARVLGYNERQLVQQLSSELDRRHRLIRAQSIERLGPQRISRYRFRHYLTQKYLYDNLDPVERAHLHEAVGNVLEILYGEQAIEIAVRLARHFQEAKISEKAVYYLHKAGDRAIQLSSYQEALTHLTAGLAMLKTLPTSNERAQQELELHLALIMAWTGARGFSIPEVTETFTRARELSQQLGDTSQLCRVLGELSLHHYVRAEHEKAYQLGEESLNLAQQVNDPLLEALGHWYTGIALFCFGEFPEARAHFQQVLYFYKPEKHHRFLVNLRGSDAGLSAFAYDACCLWCLGYPDQAQKRSQEAIALAQEMNHPFSLVDVICYAGCLLSEMRRDVQTLRQSAEQMVQLGSEKVPGWLGYAISHNGVASSNLGQVAEGIAQIQEGMAANESIDARCYLSVTLGYLAEAQVKAGQLERGLVTLDESLAVAEQSSEHIWEAELYRMRAGMLLMQDRNKKAEASLLKAIEVARRQNAKSWELRAAIDLACLWKSQGKVDEAFALLAPVYEWFTEGFETPDLISARELLESLA
jgi:adenylate cyclase